MSSLSSRTASAVAAGITPALAQSIWRADQMGSCRMTAIPTGHAGLDNELPGGGWPASALTELLLQQPGIGEMRLLRPALTAIAKRRRVALVQPPHFPQAAAWLAWGMAPEHLLWIRTARTADALWTAEQILQNGSCGALLFWQQHVRPEALRRLHLAAQGADIAFWMMRPLACAQDASPAPLRLALRPAEAGLAIDIVKRRGPQRDAPLRLRFDEPAAAALTASPSVSPSGISANDSNRTLSRHAPLDRCSPAAAAARNIPTALV